MLCKGFLADTDLTEFPGVYASVSSESLSQVLNEVFTEDTCVLSVVKPL